MDKLQQQLNDLEIRVKALEKMIDNSSKNGTDEVQTKKITLREFLLAKKLSDDVKRTLAIGYFFEKYEGLTSFNSEDLLKAYEKAKEKKPLNINDKVNMNIKHGHMAEASEKKDNKKAWYLTNSGENFVENDLSK